MFYRNLPDFWRKAYTRLHYFLTSQCSCHTISHLGFVQKIGGDDKTVCLGNLSIYNSEPFSFPHILGCFQSTLIPFNHQLRFFTSIQNIKKAARQLIMVFYDTIFRELTVSEFRSLNRRYPLDLSPSPITDNWILITGLLNVKPCPQLHSLTPRRQDRQCSPINKYGTFSLLLLRLWLRR